MQIPVITTHGWGEQRNTLLALAAPLIQVNSTELIVIFLNSSNNPSPLTFFSVRGNRGRRGLRGGAGRDAGGDRGDLGAVVVLLEETILLTKWPYSRESNGKSKRPSIDYFPGESIALTCTNTVSILQ